MPPEVQIASDSDLESVISLQETKPKSRRNSTVLKYVCSIDNCNAAFKRLDHLDRHEFQHTGIKKHACSYEGCNKIYTIVTHLKRHLRTTHERVAPTQNNVACTIIGCLKMFHSVSNMQRHIREVHENPKEYKCAFCSETFTQKLKMRRHEIKHHTGAYPYSCAKCAKGFYQQWQFDKHVPNCKIYPCPSCELTFDKWSLYIKHCKDTKHGHSSYKCEHCPNSYAKPGELKAHVTAKHFSDEHKINFKCTHEGCTRSYSYERNLRQHILIEHNGRRFPCTVACCKRAFRSAQNLAKHMKRGDHDISNVKKKVKKSKAARKKRRDAGRPLVSNLVKLSALAVDKDLDKLLREREENALSTVSTDLEQQTKLEILNKIDNKSTNAIESV